MLFKTDLYFSEYNLTVEVEKKGPAGSIDIEVIKTVFLFCFFFYEEILSI